MQRLVATTADGVQLALRRFAPRGERRAVLLCTHAMMARGGYFHRASGAEGACSEDGFAGHLARAGIDSFVLDWRGHGESVPPSPRLDDWSFDDYVELDLPAAVAAVCQTAGCRAEELAYLGHSLGGLAGLAAFGTGVLPAPRRLSLWATSVWLPGPRGPRSRRWLMALYRALSAPRGYAPVTRLRLGSDDETRGYVEQLSGWARSGRWTSLTGVDYLASAVRVTAPAFCVLGAGDLLCSVADARQVHARLPGAGELRLVGRAQGDAVDPDHFSLFTKSSLSPLWDELVAFLS